MRLTEFRRLRNAVANIDLRFVGRSIAGIEAALSGRGLAFDTDSTAITEEGIYYLDSRTGMTTKVALYNANQKIPRGIERNRKGKINEKVLNHPQIIEQLNEYHLLQCNYLTEGESLGWKGNYRIVQPIEGLFYCRLVSGGEFDEELHVEAEIEHQKLNICRNCILKINSLIGEENMFTKESFEAKYFFNAGFSSSWMRRHKYSRKEGALAGLCPRDWEELMRKRKEQAGFLCEECNLDMSRPGLKRFACIEHTDHLSKKVGYIRLRCLCLGCRAKAPNGEQVLESEEYKEFLRWQKRHSGADSLESPLEA